MGSEEMRGKPEELLVSETEEVLAGVAGAVCPCVSDSWNGWCMVFSICDAGYGGQCGI